MNYLDLLNLSLTLMDFNPLCCSCGFVPVETKMVSVSEKGGSTIQGDWILYQIWGPQLGGLHYTRDALYTRSYGTVQKTVLRLGNCRIQIPPPCLNLDLGVGENIVHYVLVLARYWIQIPSPPVWIQIYTDIHYGDCTKRAFHWASSCRARKKGLIRAIMVLWLQTKRSRSPCRWKSCAFFAVAEKFKAAWQTRRINRGERIKKEPDTAWVISVWSSRRGGKYTVPCKTVCEVLQSVFNEWEADTRTAAWNLWLEAHQECLESMENAGTQQNITTETMLVCAGSLPEATSARRV